MASMSDFDAMVAKKSLRTLQPRLPNWTTCKCGERFTIASPESDVETSRKCESVSYCAH